MTRAISLEARESSPFDRITSPGHCDNSASTPRRRESVVLERESDTSDNGNSQLGCDKSPRKRESSPLRRESSSLVRESSPVDVNTNTVTPIKSWLRKHLDSVRPMPEKPVYIIPQVEMSLKIDTMKIMNIIF